MTTHRERRTLSGKILGSTLFISEYNRVNGDLTTKKDPSEWRAYFGLSVNTVVNTEKVNTIYVCELRGQDAKIIHDLRRGLWVIVDGLYSYTPDVNGIEDVNRFTDNQPTEHFMWVWKMGRQFFAPKPSLPSAVTSASSTSISKSTFWDSMKYSEWDEDDDF